MPAHHAVLADQAVGFLVTEPDGTYLDATFGRGGPQPGAAGARDARASDRARSICRPWRLPPDFDPRFPSSTPRFDSAILAVAGVSALNGALFDIGVSSPQIDTAERGFSWRNDAPLDMRMDTTRGATAAEWLARASIEELTRIIRDYGEERFAAQVAKAIVARREAGRPVATTGDLAALVAGAIPCKSRADGGTASGHSDISGCTIHVNQELEESASSSRLRGARERRSPGGHLVPFVGRQDREALSRRARTSGARRCRRAPPACAAISCLRRGRLVARARADRDRVPRTRALVRSRASRSGQRGLAAGERMISRGFVVLAILLLFGCALGLVTAQHRARSLFVDLERSQQDARQLDVDYERLTIELARLSQPAAVERAAVRLGFRAADASQTVYLNLPQSTATTPIGPGPRK
jgi:16S rRNA (cytosine1402-N4)-methyltransferase